MTFPIKAEAVPITEDMKKYTLRFCILARYEREEKGLIEAGLALG